jgi:RsiW-degrading membrane proteinase PrsW (M82 family)
MIDFWYFVPKSGIAFIFISVALISVWNRYRAMIPHSYVVIIFIEIILFLICFLIADRERHLDK